MLHYVCYRVLTSAGCLELNKYLLDPTRKKDPEIHFMIDFGNGTKRNITYFVSHPGYQYPKFYYDVSILHFKRDIMFKFENVIMPNISDRFLLSAISSK